MGIIVSLVIVAIAVIGFVYGFHTLARKADAARKRTTDERG